MKVNVEIAQPKQRVFTANDMKIGDVAVITDSYMHGQYILRSWGGWISLTDPNSDWFQKELDLEVNILPKGSKVVLELE